MKKILSVLSIAAFSLFLTACDKPENNTGTATPAVQEKPVAKVETPNLKTELNQLISWSNTSTKAQHQTMQEIMKLNGQGLDKLQAAYTKAAGVFKQHIDELNAMPLHHNEAKTLRDKYVEALSLLHKATEMSIPYADGNMPNKARQEITDVRNQSTQKLKEVYSELNRLMKEQSSTK